MSKAITTSHDTLYLIQGQPIPVMKPVAKEEKRVYTSHDQLFKRLLEEFFAEFIAGFFPEIYESVDFSKLRFLSEEIVSTVYDEDERRLDIVAEVYDKSTKGKVIVHIEPQSYYQADFNKRMFHYASQLYRKFDKPIIPIAIYSYAESWNKDEHIVSAIGKKLMQVSFFTVHLRSLVWREYLHVKNPVVAAFLSKMNIAEDEKVAVTIEFYRMLANLKLNQEQRDIVVNFFQSYVILSKEEEEILMKTIKKQPDAEEIFEVTNPFVEYGKRAGREEGIEIGVDRGRAEGREEGIEIGEDRGREKEQINIAYKMLAKDYTDKQISEITGLSQKQINQLKQSN